MSQTSFSMCTRPLRKLNLNHSEMNSVSMLDVHFLRKAMMGQFFPSASLEFGPAHAVEQFFLPFLLLLRLLGFNYCKPNPHPIAVHGKPQLDWSE